MTTRVCNNAFPTVTKNLEVIAEDKVVTSFDVFAGSCTKDKRVPANFIVFVSDDELSALGVNPDQARIFFEVKSFDN